MYNHLDPAVVGNDQRILVTEMAGRASVELKSAELGVDVTSRPEVVSKVVERVISTEEGNGPVNALDRALRKALSKVYPRLAQLELTDYKVRIMPGKAGTDAVTRVLIETSDHTREWTTVGVHGNVIEASWLALHDAVRYGLLGESETAS
jgi:2-isopropylmalate synthase